MQIFELDTLVLQRKTIVDFIVKELTIYKMSSILFSILLTLPYLNFMTTLLDKHKYPYITDVKMNG